ncbi:kelch repeat protein [Colletotrichum gloeosporioides Cg-14]|uniref:Kelch repeat protein n=1 Tax=Colletotrichum gloeosporioides (strain Cg-14) TaxID=1237896 RepID=T0KE61_COLGC|nr:kelch repeat protein [Colletotrichum gloeosporioides Cg-14]
MWKDPSSDTFYVWGGRVTNHVKPPKKELWRFKTLSNGHGEWETVASNLAQLPGLIRVTEGTFAQNNATAYYFGGYAIEETDSNIIRQTNNSLSVPGFLTIDLNNGKFSNRSDLVKGFGDYGTFKGGSSQFVPFGTEASKWHVQKTQGDIPESREKFCTVGVPGPENTYEIFIYGGRPTVDSYDFSDVYVLSLPGFRFFKASYSDTPRADHACVRVGSGGRQMLSIGGLNHFGYPREWFDKDPWAQGLRIFDLTQMRWSDNYNASAAAYESPRVNKDSVGWSSDEVRALFLECGVVGGLAGLLALIVALFVLASKRKKRRAEAIRSSLDELETERKEKNDQHYLKARTEVATAGHQLFELHGDGDPVEVHSNCNLAEAHGDCNPAEMSADNQPLEPKSRSQDMEQWMKQRSIPDLSVHGRSKP